MSAEDGQGDSSAAGGVLSNLPRSRPGHRSGKRAGSESVSGRSAGRAADPRAKNRSARGSTASGRPPSRSGDRGRASARPVSPVPQTNPAGGGPFGGAARVAGRAARAGLGVAGGMLKRLPRP
jgi:hypothetical protein